MREKVRMMSLEDKMGKNTKRSFWKLQHDGETKELGRRMKD